jgi:MFS family permease
LAGEGPCLATFFVKRYWQLLVLRIMTGISVGGTFPLVFSLVGDLFYVTQRANVAAGVQLATGIGFAAGQAIAGFVGAFQPSCECSLLVHRILSTEESIGDTGQ